MSNDRDERTTATADRWLARGLVMMSFALLIDCLVRQLILKQHPWQWLDIFLIWMATMAYGAIGMTASGVAPYEGKLWKMWPIIPSVVVAVTVTLALMGVIRMWTDLILTVTLGIIVTVVDAVVVFIILRGIYSKWERRTLGPRSREE